MDNKAGAKRREMRKIRGREVRARRKEGSKGERRLSLGKMFCVMDQEERTTRCVCVPCAIYNKQDGVN